MVKSKGEGLSKVISLTSVSQSLSSSLSLLSRTSIIADLEISLLAGDDPLSLLDFILKSMGVTCVGETLGEEFSISSGVGVL